MGCPKKLMAVFAAELARNGLVVVVLRRKRKSVYVYRVVRASLL
jgi:hypothetical protein